MPDMQSPVPVPTAATPLPEGLAVSVAEDPDYAFGCECADPALQIAQWGQEARATGAEGG